MFPPRFPWVPSPTSQAPLLLLYTSVFVASLSPLRQAKPRQLFLKANARAPAPAIVAKSWPLCCAGAGVRACPAAAAVRPEGH